MYSRMMGHRSLCPANGSEDNKATCEINRILATGGQSCVRVEQAKGPPPPEKGERACRTAVVVAVYSRSTCTESGAGAIASPRSTDAVSGLGASPQKVGIVLRLYITLEFVR